MRFSLAMGRLFGLIFRMASTTGPPTTVIQKRAQEKDYVDIDALLRHGVDLAAGRVVYGRSFNPLITLKALSYFDDVPTLPFAVRQRLVTAVDARSWAYWNLRCGRQPAPPLPARAL
jgi:hypothetical protein